MLIDCETCVMRDLACGDCVVAHLVQEAPGDEQRFTPAESRAVAVLAGSGLVKPLRMASGEPGRRGSRA